MLKQFGIEGIYVVHALKGYELHEARIKALFAKHNLEFEFVTEGDPVYFPKIDLNTYFTEDYQKKRNTGAISCTLNHIFCLQKIIENKNKYAIVFENDPFFIGNYAKRIKRIALELDNLDPGFIISLENTTLKYPSYWQTKRGKYLYKANRNRCAGAYLIDYTGAKSALESLNELKCNDIIDWWQIRLIDRGVVNMYWAHPPIIEQGSHNGMLCSTISSKKRSIKRRISWLIQKFYKYYFRRLFNQQRIIE